MIHIFHQTYIPWTHQLKLSKFEYYSSIYDASKKTTTSSYEWFTLHNESPTPSKIAKVLPTKFPTGQILEYTETYKRGDYYKIKFISCDCDH